MKFGPMPSSLWPENPEVGKTYFVSYNFGNNTVIFEYLFAGLDHGMDGWVFQGHKWTSETTYVKEKTIGEKYAEAW